jgi:SecD/SecF fusion protein
MWCQIEKPDDWRAQDAQHNPAVAARFGEKAYVLASNKTDEAMTHTLGERQWRLQSAKPTTDQMGRRAIGFVLDERGRRPFGNVTGKNIGRPLCILLDGVAISAPSIEARIPGEGIITGTFTQTAVEDMVNKLNAGSLPARLIEQPVSVNTIGPSIGEDNRNKGVLAGFIGLITVVVFMTGYYTLAGGIAAFAMMLNLLFTLAIMAAIRATFTLPGIAGAILTIGMSVDANVLIYERIREEQTKGSSLRISIANGYQRAFSAIFDSNLTTILTAAVLYWVGSEEIKGFAIVLILGIASSMFTALIVTRVIFDILLAKRIIKNRLVMVNLVPKPHINWMRLRPAFLIFSGLLTVVGIYVFFTRDDTKNSKYDIEFTGGTSVQISLKEGGNLARQQVEQRIRDVGIKIGNRALSAANVYSVGNSGKQYEINTTETNKTRAIVTFPQAGQITVDEISAKIRKTENEPRFGEGLLNLLVSQEPNNPVGYRLTTSQLNVSLVKEILATAFPEAKITEPQVDQVVNNAVLTAFADDLEIQQNLQPTITKQDRITEQMIEQYPELVDFLGGVCIRCDLERPANLNDIEQRLDALKFRPDTRNLNWSYTYRLLGSDVNPIADPNQSFKSFTYVCVDPEAGFREFSEDEWAKFVGNEKAKVVTAAQIETSLPRVRQFDPSVGAEAKTRALIAIVLSLFAMIVYLWVRFGDVRYGVGALVALTHDTIITVGVVVACTYIAGTPIANLLLIGDFKIDLAMIAAFLTLIGYSVNDTIVVFDRIRENVGKTRRLTPDLITNSINETMPRTMMTGLTTFFVIIIMYIFGGSGLRGFNFAMAFGLIIGTYSSIAIASPILLLRTKTQPEKGK